MTNGDTRLTSDLGSTPTTGYIFGCGNCHPLDLALHMNGTVEVELFNSSAPAKSIKAATFSTGATFARGSPLADLNGIANSLGVCGNVCCHSGTQ